MGDHKSKKRKKSHPTPYSSSSLLPASLEVDTSKPTAIFAPSASGRHYTLSVALPSSILSNAQSLDLKTQLAGQIARALAVFCVDEIVIFDDTPSHTNAHGEQGSSELLQHILTYLETPQYLRRHLFPLHPSLKLAGLLPPLDLPSHLRFGEACKYREGVALELSPPHAGATLVEAGFKRKVLVEEDIPPGSRVTLEFSSKSEGGGNENTRATYVNALAVGPDTPRERGGFYWGYNTRIAKTLAGVFTECAWEDGYDVTIGTSERGVKIEDVVEKARRGDDASFPRFRHALIAFGGVAGLEQAFKVDEELKATGVREVGEVWDYYVDVCSGQGSRTIRTEEALWIALSRLKEVVECRGMQ